MSIDFDELGLKPREFALLANVSVSKLKNPDILSSAENTVSLLFEQIESITGEPAVKWLHSELSDEVPFTPLSVWKYRPSLSLLLSDPVQGMDTCFPDWRLLIYGKTKAS